MDGVAGGVGRCMSNVWPAYISLRRSGGPTLIIQAVGIYIDQQRPSAISSIQSPRASWPYRAALSCRTA